MNGLSIKDWSIRKTWTLFLNFHHFPRYVASQEEMFHYAFEVASHNRLYNLLTHFKTILLILISSKSRLKTFIIQVQPLIKRWELSILIKIIFIINNFQNQSKLQTSN